MLGIHTQGATLGIEKNIQVVSCNGLKKNRVGRSVKKNIFALFFCQKCVSCMFYVDWGLGGRKNIRLGISLNKNLLG